MATSSAEVPAQQYGREKPRMFVASPDRVSQYLELKTEEVTQQMKSVEGRKLLFDQLLAHEEDIRRDHDNFHPDALRSQLDAAGEALIINDRLMRSVKSPEKKGLMRRAWDSVKGFAKKHPVVTTLGVLALAAGGVAAGFYFAGSWEVLMANLGLKKVLDAAGAASELAPYTAPTDMLPGGGVLDIPPPISPTDIGSPL